MRFAAVLYRILAGLTTKDRLPGDEFRRQVPVVGQIGRAFQPGADGKLLRVVERRVVEHDGVKFVPVQKAADVPEERAAAHGSQIKCALEGQRLYLLIVQPPAELGGLNGVGHGAQHTLVAAAGHVGREADAQAVIEKFVDRRNAGGQIHV